MMKCKQKQWGSPIPFPTGGACVLSVIRFQDGGRRSAGGQCLMMFYFQSGQLGHSTNTIIILKSNEHKSYAWVFSVICTFQSSKFFERLSMHMTNQFECAFVTGFRDKTWSICHIYAIHYN
jgi:hypothetical protein